MAGALILEIGYGIEVQPYDDPYINTAEKALSGLSAAANAGSYLVDSFPPRCVFRLFFSVFMTQGW
jgi:hypothetical protein